MVILDYGGLQQMAAIAVMDIASETDGTSCLCREFYP